MIIPGSNLLNMALGVIGKTSAQWYMATGRTQNALGQWVTQYSDPITIEGSWQPLDAAKYEQLGLDLTKRYWTFYTSYDIQIVDRDESPDQLAVNGRRYNFVREADWFKVDGWKGIVCVDVGAK